MADTINRREFFLSGLKLWSDEANTSPYMMLVSRGPGVTDGENLSMKVMG